MYCSPQITEMAFLNSFPKGQIGIAWPQIMHTRFEDEKGLIEDFEVSKLNLFRKAGLDRKSVV